MDELELTEILEEKIAFLEEVASPDGKYRDIGQNIKSNRIQFGKQYRKKNRIKDYIKKDKPGNETLFDELESFESEWMHYFDSGFRSKYNIDDLPSLVLEKTKECMEQL